MESIVPFLPLIFVGIPLHICFFIFLIFHFGKYASVKKLRQGKCIFKNEFLESTTVSDKSYYMEDRQVYKANVFGGEIHIDSKPTTIKGDYVEGDHSYELYSRSLGYVIMRYEKPYFANTTPNWVLDSDDSPRYEKKTHTAFEIISYGSLTEAQRRKLDSVVKKATYSKKY